MSFSRAVMVTVFVIALYLAFSLAGDQEVAFGESVAIVDVYGEIFYDLAKVQEIEEHRDNDDVKAILVHINSPGGGVAASQALYHAIQSARERKPVVAMMGSESGIMLLRHFLGRGPPMQSPRMEVSSSP